MPFYLLLAMQAAGMITDFFGTQSQEEMMDKGMQAQQQNINTNIELSRIQSEEQSVSNMQNLRQTLGSQIATFAARGTSTVGGSAVSLLNQSVTNFNSDEATRKLNEYGRENDLRAGLTVSSLQNQADTSKLWQGFSSRTFNRFPSSYAGWQSYYKGAKQGFGLTSNTGAS